MRIKFKWQMLSLEVLLGICLIFWLIKPGVAYKSVAYKKRVFWLHMRIGLSTKLAKLPNVIFYKLLFSYYKICLCLMGILLILLPLNKESIGLKVFPYFRSRRLKGFGKQLLENFDGVLRRTSIMKYVVVKNVWITDIFFKFWEIFRTATL